MLHKTGTRTVAAEGLTTQQWPVLGALSRPQAQGGVSVGDLARYLMVSRQNLSDLISRMERDAHLTINADGRGTMSALSEPARLARPSALRCAVFVDWNMSRWIGISPHARCTSVVLHSV